MCDLNRIDLVGKVESLRKTYFGEDKEALNKHKDYVSLYEMKKNLASGSFRVDVEDARFECFFHKKGAPQKLYVFFCGARVPLNQMNKPTFQRWSYHSMIEALDGGAMLCVSDPMHYKYPDLKLGWYYGTADASYLELLIEIIKAICSKYELISKNVFFFWI